MRVFLSLACVCVCVCSQRRDEKATELIYLDDVLAVRAQVGGQLKGVFEIITSPRHIDPTRRKSKMRINFQIGRIDQFSLVCEGVGPIRPPFRDPPTPPTPPQSTPSIWPVNRPAFRVSGPSGASWIIEMRSLIESIYLQIYRGIFLARLRIEHFILAHRPYYRDTEKNFRYPYWLSHIERTNQMSPK